jgi:hypothetical protein
MAFFKKRGVYAVRALGMFLTGALIGVFFLWLMFKAGLNVSSWALEVAIIGLIVGGSAGLLSATKFENALKKRNL